MLTPVPPTECMQAREWASTRLDGELSELEAAHLDAHLAGCPDCADYAGEIGGLAAVLRSEPLVQPRLPVFAPRRRRAGRLNVAAVAVTMAVATASSFAVGQLVGSGGGAPSATTGVSVSVSVASPRPAPDLLGMLRRPRLGRVETGEVIPV